MGSEQKTDEPPNFSLQFSLTEGEMEEFIKQQRKGECVYEENTSDKWHFHGIPWNSIA